MNPQHVPHKDGASAQDAPSILFPATEVITGHIERIVYFNEESGQCVLDIRTYHVKQKMLISGRTALVYPGSSIHAEVLISNSDSTEDQIRNAIHIEIKAPTFERGTKKFLKSEAFEGIGPNLATLLSKAFPSNLFTVLETKPDQLKDVPGIGEKRFIQILEAWAQFTAFRELREFLFANNLPLHWGKTLWISRHIESLNFLKTYPYQSIVKYLFPFELVDPFALKLGWPRESMDRLRCGLFDLLQNHYKEGHCAYPEEKLLAEASEIMCVPRQYVEEALELEVLEGHFVCDTIERTSCIYLKDIWKTEKNVAQKLLLFHSKSPPWGWINMPRALGWAQKLLNIELAPLQKQAIETALTSSLTVITGGPGTGKTTLIRTLVTILKTQSASFALCSPTGRAAQRLEEATGVQAQTIHRLLKYDSLSGGFSHNSLKPLNLDLVLIDEVSMVDLSLMSHLLDALPAKCGLVIVGDVDQIPSVGAGNILQSIIESERFQTVRLKEIYRQKEQSSIKRNAQRINSGQMPMPDKSGASDFHYIPVFSADETKRVISDLVTNVIPRKYGISDPRQLQILVPLNRGPLGTLQLNEELKEDFTLSGITSMKKISGFGQSFKTGDKVMVTKNDYKRDVFNGDIGFIEDIDHEGQFVDILFEERQVRYGFDELDRLALAYAISIHKSQGSEYRAVIVVISKEHLPMAQRHLIYTAVTRGKEQVFLVADPSALQSAILSDDNNRRWQKLTELLQGSPATQRLVG